MWELDHKEGCVMNCCFWTVVLEKTLESPLDCKEIKPVNPKEINPEYSLEGLMQKLKLQYFGHLMRRTDSLEETLMLGKIEIRRRRGWQRIRWLDGITDSMDMSLSKLHWVKDREAWHAVVQVVTKSQTWLSDRKTTIQYKCTVVRTLLLHNKILSGQCSAVDYRYNVVQQISRACSSWNGNPSSKEKESTKVSA